jgi:4-alpha-glucanotransferase
MFQLDKDGFPKVVAGVPPDYFSATGQMWGNPLYDWKYHQKTDYSWWMDRIRDQLSLSDIVRIDHFRGLESYWEIPADAENAVSGKWVPAPGDEFFLKVQEVFGEEIPIIAEDLGIITNEVRALRDRFNLPGMKILQFAFEDDDSAYLPYNHPYNCVCYTGTHDNDTTMGWYATAPEKAKDKVRRYMNTDASQVSWDFIRTCFGSVAKYAIVPIQDVLCQGSEYRMNVPGVAEGNWSYRVKKGLLNDDIARRLREVTKLYGR